MFGSHSGFWRSWSLLAGLLGLACGELGQMLGTRGPTTDASSPVAVVPAEGGSAVGPVSPAAAPSSAQADAPEPDAQTSSSEPNANGAEGGSAEEASIPADDETSGLAGSWAEPLDAGTLLVLDAAPQVLGSEPASSPSSDPILQDAAPPVADSGVDLELIKVDDPALLQCSPRSFSASEHYCDVTASCSNQDLYAYCDRVGETWRCGTETHELEPTEATQSPGWLRPATRQRSFLIDDLLTSVDACLLAHSMNLSTSPPQASGHCETVSATDSGRCSEHTLCARAVEFDVPELASASVVWESPAPQASCSASPGQAGDREAWCQCAGAGAPTSTYRLPDVELAVACEQLTEFCAQAAQAELSEVVSCEITAGVDNAAKCERSVACGPSGTIAASDTLIQPLQTASIWCEGNDEEWSCRCDGGYEGNVLLNVSEHETQSACDQAMAVCYPPSSPDGVGTVSCAMNYESASEQTYEAYIECSRATTLRGVAVSFELGAVWFDCELGQPPPADDPSQRFLYCNCHNYASESLQILPLEDERQVREIAAAGALQCAEHIRALIP